MCRCFYINLSLSSGVVQRAALAAHNLEQRGRPVEQADLPQQRLPLDGLVFVASRRRELPVRSTTQLAGKPPLGHAQALPVQSDVAAEVRRYRPAVERAGAVEDLAQGAGEGGPAYIGGYLTRGEACDSADTEGGGLTCTVHELLLTTSRSKCQTFSEPIDTTTHASAGLFRRCRALHTTLACDLETLAPRKSSVGHACATGMRPL